MAEYVGGFGILAPSGIPIEGLQVGTLRMLQVLCDYAARSAWTFRITSAYRSPSYQAGLQAAWDAGNRVGLVVRPATSSAHSRGEAVDMVPEFPTNDSDLALLGQFATMHGYIWGGNWRNPDRVHFAIKGTETEGS